MKIWRRKLHLYDPPKEDGEIEIVIDDEVEEEDDETKDKDSHFKRKDNNNSAGKADEPKEEEM